MPSRPATEAPEVNVVREDLEEHTRAQWREDLEEHTRAQWREV